MAQLRTIGAFIDNSGIEMCWSEVDLCGLATVKQIIDGNHVKRGQTAHLVSLQALLIQHQTAFFLGFDSSGRVVKEACRCMHQRSKGGDRESKCLVD